MQWSLGRAKGQGAAMRQVVEASAEKRDQQQAERARRIISSPVWAQDFFPMVSKLHDIYLDKVKKGEAHIDALKSLDDLVAMIDGSVQLGAGAMNRIAERRLKASEIKAKMSDVQP